MKSERIEVDEYSGYRGSERPRFFIWHGVKYDVETVIDRWYEGGLSAKDQKLDYYKVRTVCGGEFILRYNALFGAWSIMT